MDEERRYSGPKARGKLRKEKWGEGGGSSLARNAKVLSEIIPHDRGTTLTRKKIFKS